MYSTNDLARALLETSHTHYNTIRDYIIAEYGYEYYRTMYRKALSINMTASYTFTDFSPQVISRSAEESSEGCERATHNED